jgi:Zn-dependent peptidase ImmA (M78 family)
VIRKPLIKKRVAALHAAVGAVRPPVDVRAVAEHCGLDIKPVNQLDRGARAQYRLRFARIDVLDSLSDAAARFAIAHEIGHAELDHGDQSCYLDYVADSAPLDEIDSGPDYEREASEFAGRLLVPREWLIDAVDRELTPPELRQLFKVSREVLFIALDRERLTKRVASGR